MRSPHTGRPMRLIEGEPATYTLRGEQFELGGPCYECDSTGERFVTDEQEYAVQQQLHQRWRERRGLDKKALRQRRQVLGLTKKEVAALLGLRKRQYHHFEQTDALPPKSLARLLALLLSEAGVAALLAAGGEALPSALRQKLGRFGSQTESELEN